MTYMICYKSGSGRHIAHSKVFSSKRKAQRLLDEWEWNDIMHVVEVE